MKTFHAFIVFMFLFMSFLAQAADSTPEQNLDTIRRLCLRDKKPKEACGCLVKNLGNKFRNGQFGEQQLADAVAAAKHLPDAPDYVADLMTGIEFHCIENSNYSD